MKAKTKDNWKRGFRLTIAQPCKLTPETKTTRVAILKAGALCLRVCGNDILLWHVAGKRTIGKPRLADGKLFSRKWCIQIDL